MIISEYNTVHVNTVHCIGNWSIVMESCDWSMYVHYFRIYIITVDLQKQWQSGVSKIKIIKENNPLLYKYWYKCVIFSANYLHK